MLVFDKSVLEDLYNRLNRAEYIQPDPLELVLEYDQMPDREIAGLLAALLAYGQVGQIVKSGRDLLGRMGNSPRSFLENSSPTRIMADCRTFKHRWTTGRDVGKLLKALKVIVAGYNSLEASFLAGYNEADETVLPALRNWVGLLNEAAGESLALLSCPGRGSACKRLNLYLRWMVREDAVDIGIWRGIHPAKLLIPLDVHMFRLSRELGLTQRKQADMKSVLEITEEFRRINPDDPVKYDFALTRLGIREMGADDVNPA